MTGLTGIPRPQPPERLPEEDQTRWEWLRQAFYYAYTASEEVKKLSREVGRLQQDLVGHMGEAMRDETHYEERLAEMATDLETLHGEIEEKVLKPLSDILATKNKLEGGKIVAFAIVALVAQVLVALAIKKIGG